MLPKAAGRGQHFQARGHSFSLYRPTLSRQITFFFPAKKLAYQWVFATLSLHWQRLCAIYELSQKSVLTCERASNLDTTQRKMY